MVGNEKAQLQAIRNLCGKRRQVETLCRKLGGLWQDMFKAKKTYISVEVKAKKEDRLHNVVFYAGK